jgi:hypothetical protein
MGISLMDLGNFAAGAIERDREITNENLKIRAEELQANRDLMISMKKDKYAADIAEYKKEKAKANEINRLNAVAANQPGEISKKSYAQQYLLAIHGPEKYKILQSNPETFDKMLNDINSARDYKFSLDRNTIDKQLEVDTKIVNKGFAKAIENAKGDSFLINKILGKKSNIDDDVNATIEDQLKAAKIVKEETVGNDIDLSKIKFKEDSKDVPYINKTSDAYKNFRKNNIELAKQLATVNDKRTSADNNLVIGQTFRKLGIPNTKDYFVTNRDGGITRFKKGGEDFANTTFSQWKMYKDYLPGAGNDNLYLAYNKDASNLIAHYNKENLNGDISNRITTYAVPVANGNISGEEGKFNFSTVLRGKDNLIVVPTANTIDFDGTVVGTNLKITNPETAKILYAQALIDNSKVNGEINIALLKRNQTTLQDLRYGKSNALLEKVNNDFINKLKNLPTTDDGTPPPNEDVDTIKITNPADGTFKIVKDTVASRNLAAQKAKELNVDISEILSEIKDIKQESTAGDIKQESTAGDMNVAEQVEKATTNKITPKDIGQTNIPVFETLNSVLSILPNEMTGQEIMDKYEIAFPINKFTTYSPSK